MSLWNYTVSFPAKIMDGDVSRLEIEVQARSQEQAEKRALAIAIREGKISDARDWRWQRNSVRLGWSR